MRDESQGAILDLMHGKYQQILPIEAEWGIRLHEADMRPRIEHFHDAVRSLTSGSADIYAPRSRLSVEQLAYDLAQLRAIGSKPVGLINRSTEKSTSSALVRAGEGGAGAPKLPPARVRGEIVSLYAAYTVFFAALFAPIADRNYQSRQDDIDANVTDLALIEQVLRSLMAGQITAAQAMEELAHVERDDLRERLQAMLGRKGANAKDTVDALEMIQKIDKGLEGQKQNVEKAHLHFVTTQLAIYEQSKPLVKQLAAQGLNLAGHFVGQTMAASAGKGAGRGV